MFPQFCVLKETSQQQALLAEANRQYYELQKDQDQAAIECAVMNEITPFLYLGESFAFFSFRLSLPARAAVKLVFR